MQKIRDKMPLSLKNDAVFSTDNHTSFGVMACYVVSSLSDWTVTPTGSTTEVPLFTANDCLAIERLFYILYGERIIFDLFNQNVHTAEGTATAEEIANTAMFSTIFRQKYLRKWQTVFNTLFTDYNPIENYDMVEQEGIVTDHTGTDTVELSHTNYKETTNYRGTKDTTRTGSEKEHTGAAGDTGESKNYTYGYDDSGATGSPQSRVETLNTYDHVKDYESVKDSETFTNRSDELEITGSKTNTDTKLLKDDTNRTLKRHGNIGITTNAQMAEGEITLRNKHDFYTIICHDIAELLTLSIY